MGFSDDYASSAASFSEDENYFQSPDVVRTSPTTTERVVDTQSGFLVVLKQVDTRIALSVKRRLGTPPVSSILLTPDECLKLSRILASNQNGTAVEGAVAGLSPAVDNWLDSVQKLPDDTEGSDDLMNDVPYTPAIDHHQRTFVARRPARHKRPSAPLVVTKKQIGIAVAIAVIIPVAAFGIKSLLPKGNQAPPHPVPVADLENARVDKFSRTFVSDMLDFSPKTYRASQVQAMASMTPDLMDKYWQETHFPLSAAQLKKSAQPPTLMITKVDQVRVADKNREVDIFAELVNADSKMSSPVHLKLGVATTDDGQFIVTDQKDLSPTTK